MRTYAVILLAALTACATPTRFEGEAKFPDGVTGCRQACAREGLEMAGFVFSGAFSTSCVCQPPPVPTSQAATDTAPTAGVIVQIQAAAAAAAQQRQMWQQQQQQQRRSYPGR